MNRCIFQTQTIKTPIFEKFTSSDGNDRPHFGHSHLVASFFVPLDFPAILMDIVPSEFTISSSSPSSMMSPVHFSSSSTFVVNPFASTNSMPSDTFNWTLIQDFFVIRDDFLVALISNDSNHTLNETESKILNNFAIA